MGEIEGAPGSLTGRLEQATRTGQGARVSIYFLSMWSRAIGQSREVAEPIDSADFSTLELVFTGSNTNLDKPLYRDFSVRPPYPHLQLVPFSKREVVLEGSNFFFECSPGNKR